jgi:4-carboxymuconolactone decarboxylase
MRLSQPRISPLQDDDLTPEQAEELLPLRKGPVGMLNVFRTIAQAPKALPRFTRWAAYVFSARNDLPARQREIVILRTGWLCKSGYEWVQHVQIGLKAGLTRDEIERIKHGADSGWSPEDSALIRATDELQADQFIGEAAWAELGWRFTDKQRMDLVFTVAHYTQVSMILNTFGVQLDRGQTLDPELKVF